MPYFAFDPATRVLVAEVVGDAANNPDVRSDLTADPPPACPIGQQPRRADDGLSWECVVWPPPPTLAQAQAQAWEQIKARRLAAFAETATSAFGIHYGITQDKANLADRIASLSAAIAVGWATSATTIEWRDRLNTPHSLDLAGLNALAAEMGARGQTIYERSWALDTLVQAATDLAGVAAALADIDIGWP